MDIEDMEKYHQNGGTYIVPVEVMNLFLDSFDTLNKGIDELINECKTKSKEYDKDIEIEPMDLYLWFIQDLKKLKDNK